MGSGSGKLDRGACFGDMTGQRASGGGFSRHAAADRDDLASDVAGPVGRQEPDQVGHIRRLTRTLHRDQRRQPILRYGH